MCRRPISYQNRFFFQIFSKFIEKYLKTLLCHIRQDEHFDFSRDGIDRHRQVAVIIADVLIPDCFYSTRCPTSAEISPCSEAQFVVKEKICSRVSYAKVFLYSLCSVSSALMLNGRTTFNLIFNL